MRKHATNAVVTGLGAVSSVGHGCEALWAAIESGQDGLQPIDRFSTDGFLCDLAGLVPDRAPGDLPHRPLFSPDETGHAIRVAGETRTFPGSSGSQTPGSAAVPTRSSGSERCVSYALEAAREAWSHARAGDAGLPCERIALCVGTSHLDQPDPDRADAEAHWLTEVIADSLSIGGPRITVSTACSSSTNALGVGRQLLEAGMADLVLAGGVDVVTPENFAGFSALGVLSPEKCAPFSEPPGTTLGEGAGFMVLEDVNRAKRRGVEPLGALLGYGLSGDAFLATAPDPRGRGVARAVRGALQDAGVEAADIGYINAHGTGTAANDASEWLGLQAVFGDHQPPVSSTKGCIGHALGAAGVLEAIVTLLAMRRHVVPPTLHFSRPRRRGPRDPVARDSPRPWRYRHALSLNSAFWGANAAVVLGGAPAPRPRAPRHDVVVAGAGAVGPHGFTLEALGRVLEHGGRVGNQVPPFEMELFVPSADPRGLEPMTRYLVVATALALSDAGMRLRGSLRERSGLLVGAPRLSRTCCDAFRTSIERNGLPRVSARAFSQMVLNAPAGTCTRLLALKGPLNTVSTGETSGLVAVALAAELLSRREDVDLMATCGIEELDRPCPGVAEGAGCLLLARRPVAAESASHLAVDLDGWGLAGPGLLDVAVTGALEQARLGPGDIDAVFSPDPVETARRSMGGALAGVPVVSIEPVFGNAGAAGSVLACVAAVTALRTRQFKRIMVTAAAGRSTTGALVMTSERE